MQDIDLSHFRPIPFRSLLALTNTFALRAMQHAEAGSSQLQDGLDEVDRALDEAEAQVLILEKKVGLR